jgi:hypothetical protein
MEVWSPSVNMEVWSFSCVVWLALSPGPVVDFWRAWCATPRGSRIEVELT